MRTIKIDFSSGLPKIECDSSAAGIQGEHRASELVIILPPDMPSGLEYRLAFDPGGMSDTLSLTNGELRYELPQSITRHEVVSMNIEGYEGGDRIYKSVMVELYFNEAVDTNSPVDADGHSIGAEVALNTAARHSHGNKAVLDKFGETDGNPTYNGQPIGGGSAGNDGTTFTPAVSADGVLSWSNDGGLENPAAVNIKGAKGDKGDKGDTGATGAQGEQGVQGIPGAKGEKGDKGDAGAAFTYSDFTAEQLAALKGTPGDTGEAGAPGITPTIGTNGNWFLGTTDTGKPSRGAKGDTGASGNPGTDGVTPHIGDNGNWYIGSTDTGKPSRGEKGAAGANGYTPVKGTDYFTEADKTELVAMVIESLGGNPVFGYVDKNNNIIVSGNLADGTYFVKYEMEDGSTVDIGDLVLDTNVYYTVTNTLTNCTNSNSATQAVGGGSYSAIITANSGYELSSVVVTMGGTDISSSAVSGGTITIANVTGKIVITAVAEEKASEPVTTNITLTDGIRVGSDGTDRSATGFCATEMIDLTNTPKPCTINLTKAMWCHTASQTSGSIRVYAKKADGTQLVSDTTRTTVGGSYFTVVDNTNGSGTNVTVTVASNDVGYIRFSGWWAGDGCSDSATDFTKANTKATLTYTPN